mmetsp:Transcript_7246/g.13747  ORF Transcript_7246/g.13747 Transcript_7246/m.13747 type:complete len:234 (-) Transcript_7246:204-905(-)
MVEQHCGVPSKFLYSCCSVLLCIHGCLDHTQRSRAIAYHLPAPDGGLLLQLTQRHHLVHEAHLHGLLSIVQTGQEPHLFGSFRAHQARHHRAAVAGVKATHLGSSLTENGVVSRNSQITHHVQDVTSPHCVSRHHTYHWLGHAPDLHLEVEDVQPGDAVLANVPSSPANRLIPPAAKRQVAGAGENDGSHVAVVAAVLHAPDDFLNCTRPKCIASFWAVDSDLCNSLALCLVV